MSLLGFAGASALGGLARNAAMLFSARALQGAFAAVMAPAALSLLTVTFTEPRERARAFGVYGAIAGSGAAIGLILGGVLTQYASWRWTLLINVPIAITAAVLAFFEIHESRAESAGPLRHTRRHHGDRRSVRARVRLHPGRVRRLGRDRHPRAPRRCGRLAGGLRARRDAGESPACCRCESCSTATGAAPSSPRCSWASPCSGRSCSSPTTCRGRSVTPH